MRCAALLSIFLFGACASPDAEVTRGGPGPSYTCILPKLNSAGLRQTTQATPEGWRINVQILAGPPSGWYDKGHIEYAAGRLAYIPNSATFGIAEKRTRKAIHPLLKTCGG
ncbi:hypothetical protein [Aliiruegeria lutimaris]|uniref:Uncharacterized protein n=1 Tax=Aliiruegeria lutimaris TaxID=571298 RepID=A0A1G8KX49_9RHOB|nr:hypothetical protein [Aliiruegeria lutimaris]SDI47480.1 hypothetical protein SAMN04488026_1003102 [Aliiruegeria lutimaris]